jgi:hypothetical protein
VCEPRGEETKGGRRTFVDVAKGARAESLPVVTDVLGKGVRERGEQGHAGERLTGKGMTSKGSDMVVGG